MGSVGQEGTNPGPDSGSNPSGKMGQTVYTRDVHPAMNKCSGGACHNADAVSAALGKYYLPDAAQAYTKITMAPTIIGSGAQAFSSIAPILTKIAAGHQGVTYSPDEISKITNWLSVETNERKDDMPSMPTVDPKMVLATFSGCLTLADFNTAQMAQRWSALAASNNQKCLNCHQGGLEGFMVSANAQIFFDTITQQSAYMLKYFAVDTNSTPAKVIINTGSMTNAGVTLVAHPRFNPTDNIGMTALRQFYDLAVAKQTAGTCGPSTLKD
jgi:hypothetical protein